MRGCWPRMLIYGGEKRVRAAADGVAERGGGRGRKEKWRIIVQGHNKRGKILRPIISTCTKIYSPRAENSRSAPIELVKSAICKMREEKT